MLWHKAIGAGGIGGATAVDVSFYESRYGSDIGTIEVYIVDSNGTILETIYTVSGDTGTPNWSLINAQQTSAEEPFRVVWRHYGNTGFRADYAIDLVSINVGGTQYTYDIANEFEQFVTSTTDTTSSTTALSSAATPLRGETARTAQWNLWNSSTPSSSTGPSSAYSESYFAYTESSSPNSSAMNFWLFSPLITP